jgi:hypothetical protein
LEPIVHHGSPATSVLAVGLCFYRIPAGLFSEIQLTGGDAAIECPLPRTGGPALRLARRN